MSDPYHVRLAISQYGDQLRAEIFTEDLGDTNGDPLPAKWERLNDEFKSYLAMGATGLPADTARLAGQELFESMLGQGENGKKWTEILHRASAAGRPIRLLIDATTDLVRDLPYGLLCDPADDCYLLRPSRDQPQISYVRILRRCTPRQLDLDRPRLKLLLVGSEPARLPKFACARRLADLINGLPPLYDVCFCTADGVRRLAELAPAKPVQPEFLEPFCHTTRDAFKQALSDEEFDIVHLLAHGFANGVILCDDQGARAEATSGELGEWCGAGDVQMAFLQVCKASLTDGRGGFGGVAQQLLNPKYGNLAAVVASPYPIDAERCHESVASFYNALADGQSPDAALDRQLDETNWSWAFLELWVRPSALKDTGRRGAFQFASPYLGLTKFGERDAEIFFGREAETAELVKILTDETVVAVVGDSGSGKSSLLEAGLAHHIRRYGLGDQSQWQILTLTPGDRPHDRLVSRVLGSQEGGTVNIARKDGRISVRDEMDKACRGGKKLLIIFDQFEELFTLCHDEAERRELAEALAAVAAAHPNSFRLVLGMRSDYLGPAAALPGLIQMIKRPWVLKPPGEDEIRAIVSQPAEHHGYAFEGPAANADDPRHATSLLDRILNDPLLRSEPPLDQTETTKPSAPLPLLEFALERLWLRAVQRGTRVFQHSDYDEMGGLAGAIAQHAEEAFVALSSRHDLRGSAVSKDGTPAKANGIAGDPSLIAERIWTGLISGRGTRRPRHRDELETETGNPQLAPEIISYLVGERLLTIRADSDDLTHVRIDISHEVLLTSWKRLRAWLSIGADGRALKEEFQKDAERWNLGMPGTPPRNHRNLPGPQASNVYLTWLDTMKPSLTAAQQAFADALQSRARRQKRVRRGAVFATVVVALLMSGLAIYARVQQQASEARLAQNRIQRGVDELEAGNPAIGMSWLLRAFETVPKNDPLRDSVRNLLGGWNSALGICLLDESPVINVAFDPEAKRVITVSRLGKVRLWDPEMRVDSKLWYDHDSELAASAFSSDKKYVATGDVNGAVRLSELSGAFKGRLLPGAGPCRVLAFSHDGGRIAAAGEANANQGQIRIWETLSGDPVDDPLFTRGAVLSVALRSDGQAVCAGTELGQVLFWEYEADSETEPRQLWPAGEPVVCVAFSPNGKWLAAGIENGHIILWDTEQLDKPLELKDRVEQHAHEDRVDILSFSPDSTLMVSGSMDNTARIWEVATKLPVGYVMHHGGPVFVAVFSQDGTLVLTGSGDGAAQLWDASSGKEHSEKVRHDRQVIAGAISPNADKIVIGTYAHSARLWDMGERNNYREIDRVDVPVTTLSFGPSAGGKGRLVVGDEKGHVRLWDFDSGHEPPTSLPGKRDAISAVGLAPNGDQLAVAAASAVTLWNPSQPDKALQQWSFRDLVTSVAFNHDGSQVLTGCRDGNVQAFDTASGKQIGKLATLDVAVLSVACCPKGRSFVTGGDESVARIWDATSREPIGSPLQHRGAVLAVAYSPDGNTILTASQDGTARLWDAVSGESRTEPLRHNGPRVVAVAFSSDGSTVLTGSWEGTAKMWDTRTGAPRGKSMWHEPRVNAVGFSPDLSTVVTASNDGSVWMWPFQPALADDSFPDESIPLWVQVRTGHDRNGQDMRQPIGYDDWLQRRARLNTSIPPQP